MCAEVTSAHALLDPRWQGKISTNDPYLPGIGLFNASRYYLRSADHSESMPDEAAEWSDPVSFAIGDKLATQITVRETIKRLHEKCRKTLLLKYWNGSSASEMATELNTTNRYAEKLIHNCLKRVRDVRFGASGRSLVAVLVRLIRIIARR